MLQKIFPENNHVMQEIASMLPEIFANRAAGYERESEIKGQKCLEIQLQSLKNSRQSALKG